MRRLIRKSSQRSPRLVDRWNDVAHRHRVSILLASVVYATTLAALLIVGATWLREDSIPSIRVLGSGSRLSLLIVSAESRLLIASGDDASAFANALAQARHPTNRRLDVIILAGDAQDLAVAKRARRDLGAAAVFVIDGPLAAYLDDLALDRNDVIVRPALLRLPGGIDVTVAPASTRDGAWTALIQRGTTRILAGSGADMINRSDNASATVLTGESDVAAFEGLTGQAMIVSSRSITARDLRDAITEIGASTHAIRIEPASVAALKFVEGGLELPSSTMLIGEP